MPGSCESCDPTVPFCETMLVVSPVARVEDHARDIAHAGVADLAVGQVEPGDRQGRPPRAPQCRVGRLDDLGWFRRAMPRKTRTASAAACGRRRAVPQPVDHQDETHAVALDHRPVVATDLLAGRGSSDHSQLQLAITTACESRASHRGEPRGPSRFRTGIDLEGVREAADRPRPVPGEPAVE